MAAILSLPEEATGSENDPANGSLVTGYSDASAVASGSIAIAISEFVTRSLSPRFALTTRKIWTKNRNGRLRLPFRKTPYNSLSDVRRSRRQRLDRDLHRHTLDIPLLAVAVLDRTALVRARPPR